MGKKSDGENVGEGPRCPVVSVESAPGKRFWPPRPKLPGWHVARGGSGRRRISASFQRRESDLRDCRTTSGKRPDDSAKVPVSSAVVIIDFGRWPYAAGSAGICKGHPLLSPAPDAPGGGWRLVGQWRDRTAARRHRR